jgi:hypothetical protein
MLVGSHINSSNQTGVNDYVFNSVPIETQDIIKEWDRKICNIKNLL